MTGVRLLLTLLVVMALGVATAAPLGLRSLDEPMAAAPLSLPNLDGESVDLASLRGKAVVVNFWASWCAPCVREMPALERVAESLADDGVRFLAVAMAQRAEEILAFEHDVLGRPIPFPVLVDSDATVSEA